MKKLLGEERRLKLLTLLKQQQRPITGTDLAKHTNVSRQVIVNDMNLLKARNEPIVATSQGYLYMEEQRTGIFERKIVCMHTGEQTREELYTIVDCGVTVENVIIEHAVYGEITASILVSNRLEVDLFLDKLAETNANFLSALTGGTHLHVISASSEDLLDKAVDRLREKGLLVEN
ncbi:transcription repressor NadR [Lysinibacillus sp. 3P01SB]|uniref:transcription repressor NadR n=1 Tax=Lysinibacillus sp. 3P01SB TaxID=3132284 RepID=UPI0039A431B5